MARLRLKPQEGLGRLGCKGQIGVHQESKAEGCFKTSCLTSLPRRGDPSGQPLRTLPPVEHSPVLGRVVLDLCPKSQTIPGPLREAGWRGPEAQSARARAGPGPAGHSGGGGIRPPPCPKPLIFTGTEITDCALVLSPPQHPLALYRSPEPPCGLQRPSAPLGLSLPTWRVGADTQLHTLL